LPHALLRGQYSAAAANIEYNGIPLDVVTMEKLLANWDELKGKKFKVANIKKTIAQGRP
jgi:hypothetical protein